MIPFLYSPSEVDFDTGGIGRFPEAIRCEVHEELNGVFELELDVPISAKYYDQITHQSIIYANTPQGKQPFEVYAISRPLDGVVTISAQHISYRLAKMTARPFTKASCSETLAELARQATQAEGETWSYWTDKNVSAPWTLTTPRTIRNCIGGENGSILQLYGGELEWNNRQIKLHTHRGQDNHVTIRYGKNLTDLLEEDDTTEIYTSVLPFWYKAGENGEEDVIVFGEEVQTGLDQIETAYNMCVPLDLSQEFSGQEQQEVVDPETGETSTETVTRYPTSEELTTSAQTHMVGTTPWLAKDSLKVSFIPLSMSSEYEGLSALETVNLGDTVGVIYTALGVTQSMKAIEYHFDSLLDRYIDIELGSKKASFGSVINDRVASAQSETNAKITAINGRIVAVEGQFGKIDAMEAYIDDLTANNITANYITAIRGDFDTLSADYAATKTLLANQIQASEVLAGRVSANEANITNLQAGKADIGDLNAAVGNINTLNTSVANIKTLLGGNVGTGDLQTINLTADNTVLSVALIKDLIAQNVTVNDLKAADIDADRIGINGEAITIDGRTIQVKDDNGNVRIQIGLDAQDNFTFTLFDSTGQGVLINENGITANAIGNGLIVDSHVANNANISGSKLNINSVITEVNKPGTSTIKSNKIYLDDQGQTLNVAFNNLETVTDDLTTTTEGHTTELEVLNGKISALITDDEITDLNTRRGIKSSAGVLCSSDGVLVSGSSAVQRMESHYNQTVMDIDGLRTSLGAMETEFDGEIETIHSQVAEYKAEIDEFSTYIGDTYVTIESLENSDYVTTSDMNSAITQSAESITSTVSANISTIAQQKVDEAIAKTVGVFDAKRTVNEDGTLTYTAEVIRGLEDVVSTYPSYCFSWFRLDDTGEETLLGYGYSMTVDPSDFTYLGHVVGIFSVFDSNVLQSSAGALCSSAGVLVGNFAN